MIKLYFETLEHDITSYVDESSIVYSDNIDKTRAHGGFTIPFVKSDVLRGIDLSKPLPRLMRIYLNMDDEETYWVVSEDRVNKVRKGDSPLYSHEITIIEPTVILENRTLPDMTVTQPKGALDNFIYNINIIDNETTIVDTITELDIADGYEETGVLANNTLSTLGFNYGVSNDITVLDDNVLKEVRTYTIQLNLEVYNIQWLPASPEAQLELSVYSDGVLISDLYTLDVPKATTKFKLLQLKTFIYPYSKTLNVSFEYTSTSINEVITVKARTTGLYNDPLETEVEDELWITSMGFNILTAQTGVTEKSKLEDVVDKILLIQQSAPLSEPSQEFQLADESRVILKSISPEFTFKGYTVFDALDEVASYVGAIVFLGENDWSTVYIKIFEDGQIEGDIDYLEEEQNVFLTDYVTGLEINAQNVINEDNERYVAVEPSETGWLSIRTTDIGQITDTNATIHTSRPFYRSYQVLVKGLAFTMYDGATPVPFADTVEWDISNFVVEQARWNALENVALDTRSGVVNKGNTIFYTQGEKMLYNIGYNDVILAPAWNTATPANYAIVEAILCQAAVENPTYTFSATYSLTPSLFDLSFRIYYMPYTNARVTVYRDDAARLNQSFKYFNETASINDMKSLGDIAHRHANRKGNAISSYKGISSSIYNLIRLGMKNDRGEVLTSYEVAFSPQLREFVLHYSKENPNISAYKGTPSAYRQWEIPKDDLVYRKDKYSEYVYLSEFNDSSIYTIYTTNQILANFQPIPDGEKLTYAVIKLDYDGLGYTETVEATIDTLAFGTTSALQIEMQDNYSAGAKQITGDVVGGVTQTRQADTLYGDDLGRVENINILTYVTYSSDPDNYPDNDTVTTGEESDLEIVVKKDAREIWGLTQELVFRSNYVNVKVYSGMAKFNGLVAKGSTVETRPLLLKKGYFPTNENIELSKTIQTTWDSTITVNELYTEIDVPAGEYEGYLWIEIATMTPIFAVRTSDFDSLTPATLGHNIYYNTSYALMVSNYSLDLTNEIEITDAISLTLFIFPIVNLVDTIDVTTVVNELMQENYFVDLVDTFALTSIANEFQSTDFVLDLVDTMAVSDAVSEAASTQFIIDLVDVMAMQSITSLFKDSSYITNLIDTLSVSSTETESQFIFPIIDLVDSMAMSDTVNEFESTNFTIDLTDTMAMGATINTFLPTDFTINLTDTIIASSSITETQPALQWIYVGTTGSYDKLVVYVSSGSKCATTSVIETWLAANYPATDYSYGYIIRVTRGNEDLFPCTPVAYYYQAG